RHPGLSHLAFVLAGFVIQRDSVGHLITHFLHEWGDQCVITLETILADDHQSLLFVFIVDLIEMRNRDATRTTPSGPELHQVSFAFFERGYGLTLDPFAVL